MKKTNAAYFVGGSDNPYNYSGIGYNGVPSTPDAHIWRFDFNDRSWQISKSQAATMDHRTLINLDGKLLTVGGMLDKQQVTDKVIIHRRSNANKLIPPN